jgi:hypothetical protein
MSCREIVAEGEGFEPPVPFRVQWFSRPPPSTARPSLRVEISPKAHEIVVPQGSRSRTPLLQSPTERCRLSRLSLRVPRLLPRTAAAALWNVWWSAHR